MEASSLTEFLIKNLVNDPETVSVKQFDDENSITIEVLVSSEDIGRVIGKKGMIIGAIRTIVQASSRLNDGPFIKINIDSI